MNEVTGILSAIERGDPTATGKLLPLVYDELRKLAVQKLARELPGHTLDATALVHEAYLRLVGEQEFDNRGHFFPAPWICSMLATNRSTRPRRSRSGRLSHGSTWIAMFNRGYRWSNRPETCLIQVSAV
jgi:hypothetical protein